MVGVQATDKQQIDPDNKDDAQEADGRAKAVWGRRDSESHS